MALISGIAANLLILITIVWIGIFFHSNGISTRQNLPDNYPRRADPDFTGITLPSTVIDWSKGEKNLLFFLSSRCGFCIQSAPFYKRLTNEAKKSGSGLRTFALFNVEDEGADEYIRKFELNFDEIKTVDFKEFKISATPTILEVGSDGNVRKVWIGKLDSASEGQVISNANAQ